jgi:signal transduction histidine kinase
MPPTSPGDRAVRSCAVDARRLDPRCAAAPVEHFRTDFYAVDVVTTVPTDRPTLLPDDAREVSALLSQVAWFNRLRLMVGAGVIWLCAMASHALGIIADPWPLYTLGAAILVVDGVYLLVFPRLQRREVAVVRRHVYLQIAVDLLILTGLLHWSGGITNPLSLFYLFHAFIAALVLSITAAVVVAVASLLLLLSLGFAERLGWIAHHPLQLGLADLAEVQPLGFWLLVFAYAVTMGFSIYFVATVLGRLKQHEQQLVRLGRHLALSEKLASVGTLAAGVSHEINNPIGVIANKVQILRYRLQDGDSADKLLPELDVIDKHSKRIAQITAGLLQFSRETPFELRPLDLGHLLREAADLVRVPFRAAEVELASEVRPLPPGVQVLGSPNHLLQVLINILLNAKDASPRGAVVELAAETVDREVALCITDHGTGIAAEHLAKVFDPFFTTKDVDKGTGLGLAISHGIIERHHGRIEVESEVGRGTRFRVMLPTHSAASS